MESRPSRRATGRRACDPRGWSGERNEVDAFADGNAVAVTTGAMDFIETDEELAYLLGHELAHYAYGHFEAVKSNAFLGALHGAIVTVATGVYSDYSNLTALYHAPKFEVEADYVGAYFAARAGYDVTNATKFWSPRTRAPLGPRVSLIRMDRRGSTSWMPLRSRSRRSSTTARTCGQTPKQ